MLRLPALAIAFAFAASPTLACPVSTLVTLSKGPLGKLKKAEFDVAEQQSAEGGRWQVYSRRDGIVHSIVRTDYGETGRTTSRASFLDAKTFAITVAVERYDKPIGTTGDVKVAGRTAKTFLYCEREGKILGSDGRPGTPGWLKEAREERRTFEAEELAPHLANVKR